MSTSFRLLLPRQLLNEMIAHAQTELPNECCGILAGTIGADGIAHIERRYGLVNALASPAEYLWDPRSTKAANHDMDARGIQMLAIYHSHPTSDPIPSHRDRERYEEVRLFIGDVMHFIVGLREPTPSVRAWWLERDDQREAAWEQV